MSIEQANEVTEELQQENVRDYYKDQARILGLTYRQNIPTSDLKTLVEETLLERSKIKEQPTTAGVSKLSKSVVEMQQAATSLVRCTIDCLDPNKKEWQSMLFTVANDNVMVKRLVPVNGVVWHVERILLDYLKGKTYMHYPTKYVNGRAVADMDRGKKLPMFKIVELPPLTEQELKDLAEQQRQNGTGQQEN